MSKLNDDLQELKAAEQRIREKRGELIARRKVEVASLIERLGIDIMAMPDELIAGVLLEAHPIVSAQKERAGELASIGAKFLKGKKSATKAVKETAGAA